MMANEEMMNEELTAEQLEDLAKEPLAADADAELQEGALADEALEGVAGGAGAQAGTKLYLVNRACAGFNQALPLGRRQIASLRRGQYLCNCRLVKVIGMGDWVNYAAYGNTRNGPWQAQSGWTQAENCILLAY